MYINEKIMIHGRKYKIIKEEDYLEKRIANLSYI